MEAAARQDGGRNQKLNQAMNQVLNQLLNQLLNQCYFLEVFSFLSYGFQNLQKGFLFAEEIIVLKPEWRKTENWEKDTGKILM